MLLQKIILAGAVVLLASGCAPSIDSMGGVSRYRHVDRLPNDAPVTRTECSTVGARINALIAKGQFAEAEALIAEATAGGLISQPQAAEKLQKIAQLSTKAGQLSASLQRAKDFPSQLKDYTLFEIKRMLENRNFSLATEAQLKMVKKLLEDPERVMEKMGTVR